jgi:hypothetical protein
MNRTTTIIEAEAAKHINEFIKKGYTEEESLGHALHKINTLRKENPLVAIHWEVEKALTLKISNHISNNGI